MSSSYDMAMKYKNVVLGTNEYYAIQNDLNYACLHYILGQTAITWKTKSGHIKELISIYGYSETSLIKFARFAHAVDALSDISPELAVAILEEKIPLSMENTLRISKKEPDDILHIFRLLSERSIKVCDAFPRHSSKGREGRKPITADTTKRKLRMTIKDTPAYDPDAQTLSLSYTIPSWVNATRKIVLKADLDSVSTNARCKLRQELVALIDTAVVALNLLEEKR